MDAIEMLGALEMLGRAKRKQKLRKLISRKRAIIKRPLVSAVKRQARRIKLKKVIRQMPPKARKTLAKKVVKKALFKRMAPAAKKALIKRAIAKNPALKKRLAKAILLRRLKTRQDASPPAYRQQETPVPSDEPTAPAVDPPADAPIETEHAEPWAEVVEEETQEGALQDVADAENAADTAVEESETDVEVQAVQEAQNDDDALTEPDPDDYAEEAAEEGVDDAVEAVATEGEELMGYLLGVDVGAVKRKRALKKKKIRAKAKARLATAAAIPTAKKIAKVSKGKIPAKRIMKGVAVIAAAKAGNVKAKAAIKKISARAKRGDKKAKKTLAQLKLSNKVLAKGKRDAKKTMGPIRSRLKRKVVRKTTVKRPHYKPPGWLSQPLPILRQGFDSYSAYQRGMAMVPYVARARYGSR